MARAERQQLDEHGEARDLLGRVLADAAGVRDDVIVLKLLDLADGHAGLAQRAESRVDPINVDILRGLLLHVLRPGLYPVGCLGVEF